MMVDLPAPEGPAMATVSPRAIANETSSSTQAEAASDAAGAAETNCVSDMPERKPPAALAAAMSERLFTATCSRVG